LSHPVNSLSRGRSIPITYPRTRALERLTILYRDRSAILAEFDTASPKSLLEVRNKLLNGGVVNAISWRNAMGYRPAGNYHHGNQDLSVVWLAVATITFFGKVLGANPARGTCS
jgi:hypothetical protein